MVTRELKTYQGKIRRDEPNTSWIKIVNLIEPGSRVLEIGCAAGHIAEFLTHQKGCCVTGIELNPAAARGAEAFCDEVIIGDVEDDALRQVRGVFDVIVLADVLEHLSNPYAVLSKTAHLLSDTGYVLISVPNVAHWEVRKDLLFGRFEYTDSGLMDSTHIRFFTDASIRRLIWNAGFNIEVSDMTHRLPRHCLRAACDRKLHLLITKACRGLFGYQFIFKAAPKRAPKRLAGGGSSE